jgi:T-complex protein 1 subunit beta
MASFNPTQIFEDGTTEEKGENARLSAFVGAIAVGDLGEQRHNLAYGLNADS